MIGKEKILFAFCIASVFTGSSEESATQAPQQTQYYYTQQTQKLTTTVGLTNEENCDDAIPAVKSAVSQKTGVNEGKITVTKGAGCEVGWYKRLLHEREFSKKLNVEIDATPEEVRKVKQVFQQSQTLQDAVAHEIQRQNAHSAAEPQAEPTGSAISPASGSSSPGTSGNIPPANGRCGYVCENGEPRFVNLEKCNNEFVKKKTEECSKKKQEMNAKCTKMPEFLAELPCERFSQLGELTICEGFSALDQKMKQKCHNMDLGTTREQLDCKPTCNMGVSTFPGCDGVLSAEQIQEFKDRCVKAAIPPPGDFQEEEVQNFVAL